MRNNELKNLKSRLEVIRKSNESIYLQLNDVIYRTIGAGVIEEVQEIPPNAVVENINCDKKHFVYLLSVNGKSYWTEIISVSESIKKGTLPDNGWLDKNGME